MYHEFIKKNGADSRISREILERQYMGVGKPDDIERNRISDGSGRFITGITLPVDGGMTTS